MNRREFLRGMAIIPFIPYISLPKYYIYYYTEYEGGYWKKLRIKVSSKDMEIECRNEKNWIIVPYGAPKQFINNQKQKVTKKYNIIFQSLKFPDGRIWDSHFREFRLNQNPQVKRREL